MTAFYKSTVQLKNVLNSAVQKLKINHEMPVWKNQWTYNNWNLISLKEFGKIFHLANEKFYQIVNYTTLCHYTTRPIMIVESSKRTLRDFLY